ERAMPEPKGVEESRCAEGERRDADLEERAASRFLCCRGGVSAGAEEQPRRQQCERESGDLAGGQRLAQQSDDEKHSDEEIHAEDRRVGADRTGRKAAMKK